MALASIDSSPPTSWLLLTRRPALRSPTARAVALAGALTGAAALVLGPVELVVDLAHIATTGASPFGVAALTLTAVRIWRHHP